MKRSPFRYLILIIFISASSVYGQSSANYKIEAGVISGGGGEGSSTNYDLLSTFAQPSPIGTSASSSHTNYAGFWNEIEGGEPLYLSLGTGWNLFSLPLQPSNTSISSVLNDISGNYSAVWAHQNGKWKMHDPSNPGFSDLSTLEPRYGYWIKMT